MIFDLHVISFIVLSIISPSWMFSKGPPDEIWAKENNKPTKNTCILMDPSVSNTHKGGMQETEVPFEIKSNKKKAKADAATAALQQMGLLERDPNNPL